MHLKICRRCKKQTAFSDQKVFDRIVLLFHFNPKVIQIYPGNYNLKTEVVSKFVSHRNHVFFHHQTVNFILRHQIRSYNDLNASFNNNHILLASQNIYCGNSIDCPHLDTQWNGLTMKEFH